jgi:hypothetical protein
MDSIKGFLAKHKNFGGSRPLGAGLNHLTSHRDHYYKESVSSVAASFWVRSFPQTKEEGQKPGTGSDADGIQHHHSILVIVLKVFSGLNYNSL